MAARAKEGRAEATRAEPHEPDPDGRAADSLRRASFSRLLERAERVLSPLLLREKGAPLAERSSERHAACSSAFSFGFE